VTANAPCGRSRRPAEDGRERSWLPIRSCPIAVGAAGCVAKSANYAESGGKTQGGACAGGVGGEEDLPQGREKG